MKRLFFFFLCTAWAVASVLAEDVELTSVADLTAGYFIMAYDNEGTFMTPYWTPSNNQNVKSPEKSALICSGTDNYFLLKAEEITYKGEHVYRISISNSLHQLYPRGIGGAAYMNSAGWVFFAGECEATGKSHVYGQDGDGLGLWRITYAAGKGFQFQCVGNDKYVSYTMGHSSSADKYYWHCFAEGSLYDAEALKQTQAFAEYTTLHDLLAAWMDDRTDISCEDAARTTLGETLVKIQKNVDIATTVEQLRTAIESLRTAAGAFLEKAQVAEGCQLDVTILIKNPSFETGTIDGWTAGKPSQGGDVGVKKNENEYETADTDGSYLFNSWSVSDSYSYGSAEQYVQQTLTNMQPGEYRLTALASSNTYQSVNAPVELFGNDYVSSFVPQSKSTFKQTYEVTIYLMPQEKELTIGMRSGGWFRADKFQLVYYGRTEAYEQTRRMTAINRYEEIARQAIDRTAYDAVLTEVRQAMQVPAITDDEIAQQNTRLREALMELIQTGTTATGQFDITCLLNNTDVCRASDVSALTTFAQKLALMPAGHYTFRANAFYRPAPIAEALEMYEGGTEDHPASIYLGKNTTTIPNIFDESRHALSNSMDILATVDGRAAPMTEYLAMEAFDKGDYGVAVEYDLATGGNLTLGFRIKAPKKSGNQFIGARQQLLYGATPTRTFKKNIPAGKLTPLCVPFELTSDETRQLYCVGSILDGEATVFPVATVHAGEPCVISATEDITSFQLPATQVSQKQADTVQLPWDGGSISCDPENFTWTATSVDGKRQTKAEALTFTIADPMNMDFTVNLENLPTRRFLELEDYTATSSSRINDYNNPPPARRDQPNNVGVPVTSQGSSRYKLTLSTDPDFSEKTTLSGRLTDGKLFYAPNLIPQRTYYYEITAGTNVVGRGKFHTEGRLRMIYAPSIDNIRDLGGWKNTDGKYIRYERIYRGGELNGSHEATAAAVKRLKTLGVTSEIDLRIDYEQSSNKSAFGFTEAAGTFYYANAMDCYPENLTSEECYARWKAEFDLIMRNLRKGGAIYFHCRIGADRTGLLSLMLEGLLGIPEDQSYKNYELTTFSPSGVRLRSTQADFVNYFKALKGKTLQEKYQTFFIEKLGVSQADIDEFRSIMLTDDPANAIDDISASPSAMPVSDAVYDLAGRRIRSSFVNHHSSFVIRHSSLPKGIYIVGGRKVLVK